MHEQTAERSSGMRGLILLNVVLLILLGAVTFGSQAIAQTRVRGDYVMVGGGANGANSGVVYVVDTVNNQMIAVTYDNTTKALAGVGARNLSRDGAQVAQGGRP